MSPRDERSKRPSSSTRTFIPTHKRHLYTVLDIEHNEAAVPGDGSAVMAMTFTKDVARFVAGSLDLDKWPKVSLIVASQTTLNELVKTAETVTGSKLDVRFDSVESLQSHDVKLLKGNDAIGDLFEGGRDRLKALACDLGASIALGAYDVSNAADGVDLVSLLEDTIGAPVRIGQFLGQYWSSY
ncbi:hypothetical protein LTR10_020441 [Elasticomyces elasticus]|uniref:NmrA-like domain-containing protein n=1 Tax=Exophiala sideris TaxID=1016849 RepID=A0ABR0J3M6_9EURO|nr:hypothetical protein LTR10_020441 [Elasticomyces elasticus]KAK5027034.1 hypothetical protein LTS07_007333 [Exophiala sideris]KAK5034038.1 hypothetical protein LTR13_006638 [Exophiala sideris]KAK5055686.1 hypothetical protein LTR69_008061 [Exophiala sideris]KAK5180980.1 hypothetical protein LTR44_006800 [Eurotiomycetes sp. CCFEE 6388]